MSKFPEKKLRKALESLPRYKWFPIAIYIDNTWIEGMYIKAIIIRFFNKFWSKRI